MRKEIVSIKHMVTSKHFNSKMRKSCYQFSTVLEFIKSRHHRREFIRTFTMKVFIQKAQESYITAMGK